MAIVGTAVIDVIANTAKFEAGVRGASKSLSQFTSQAKLMGGVVGAAVAAGLVALTRSSMQNIDALAKQSDLLNASTESLATYKLQAELAGIGGDQFTQSLTRMVKAIGDARRGGGEAAETFKRLGLDVNDLARLRADEQFDRIAQKINGMATQVDKVSAAAGIFGARDGARMLAMIQDQGGAAGVTKEQLIALNVALNRVDAAKVEAANDAMTKAGQTAVGLGNTIAVSVSPFIEELGESFFQAGVQANGFANEVQLGMDLAVNAVGVFADGLRGLHVAFKVLELGAYQAAAGTNLILAPFLNKEVVDASVESVRRVGEELDALLLKPLPSEAMKAGMDEIVRGANERAKALAKAREDRSKAGAAAPDALETGGSVRISPAAEAAAAEAKALNGLADELMGVGDEEDNAAKRRALLNKLYAEGKITGEAYRDELANMAGAYDVVDETVVKVSESINESNVAMSAFADQAARNMQGIVAGFLKGEVAGKNFFQSMLKGLADLAAEMAAQQILTTLFNAVGGYFGARNIGTTFFGGGKAHGGPVSANKAYLVGEEGPEIMVPGSSGAVIPNNKIGGSSVKVTYNVDARGADPASAANMIRALQQTSRETEKRVYEALRRGTAPV